MFAVRSEPNQMKSALSRTFMKYFTYSFSKLDRFAYAKNGLTSKKWVSELEQSLRGQSKAKSLP